MGYDLKSERLTLHKMTDQYFDFVVKLETRPENTKYEMGDIPKREDIIEECKEYIEAAKKLPQCEGIKYIVCNDKEEMIGTVSLQCNSESTKVWEIGYGFLSEYWGKGYASEATKLVIEFAFNKLGVHKLVAFINAENKRSVALAKRVGMIQELYMREARLIDDNWNDEYLFSLLKSDLK